MLNKMKSQNLGITKLVQAVIIVLLLSVNLFAQTFTVDSKDGRNQASFISDAPLEKINGLASGLSATVMINTNDITKNPMGKVTVPISNIKTGIDLRDEHLRSEMWLNAAKYTNAEFQLTGIKNPSSKSLNDGQRVKATLLGKFSVHGVTKEIEVPATLTYFKESERTKAKAPGNLLVANADFRIKLADYGVKIPDMVVGKVNDEVEINVNFVASDKNVSGNNPCNPCAMDNGKCNPCAMKNMKKGQCNPCAMKK
ncbi:YceI family protein [Ignavibacterium sp.]|uniref:YceI family protein n=1 Tax=Ignavibacterium sp. TaxID=2651167 RepID=UPI00307E462F